jgi:hypothetical protein
LRLKVFRLTGQYRQQIGWIVIRSSTRESVGPEACTEELVLEQFLR